MMDAENNKRGCLSLVATPIGNLEDMSPRAIRTLREADLIAAEDTRNSIRLLRHFDIPTPMTSYHEHNKYDKAKRLIEKMKEGAHIALVTDAGTPGISDPGEVLVALCHEQHIPVTPIPGAAACVNALIVSGLPTRRFVFEAFLPDDKKERRAILEQLQEETRTIVLYEAPHRLLKTLTLLRECLGERKVCVCRELTKRHETVYKSQLSEAIGHFTDEPARGECVVVIEGMSSAQSAEKKRAEFSHMTALEHVSMYMDEGMDKKQAMKAAAKDRGVSKSLIYKQLLQ